MTREDKDFEEEVDAETAAKELKEALEKLLAKNLADINARNLSREE